MACADAVGSAEGIDTCVSHQKIKLIYNHFLEEPHFKLRRLFAQNLKE